MLIHPERRNQPTGGGVDWTVFALDTLGLLLFFIPGVIAFAVDFTTGAIYLPPHPEYGDNKPPANEPRFVTVQVPRKDLNERRLAEVASEHAGRDVRLIAGEYKTVPLTKLDEFWTTRERLAAVRG
ncbi:MAG TPA: hypothetical protein VHU84_03445 [Lacipirellulaceae bacterium]|nr:hypothetical protein [Lacipirellulaceae bacterium]